MKNPVTGAFCALSGFNYRVWAAGAMVSNIGTWMQRIAQDWLVFTQLTNHDASSLGIVMGLQFAPQLILLPWTGLAADRFNQRKLLMLTQATMGVLALILGVLTVEGVTRLWHVYVFAFLFGSAAALDAPVRQTFVAELVGDEYLSNAVALNSISFNAARMIGPALAGLLIAKVGTGWAFLLNGISFAGVLISMSFFRVSELQPSARARRAPGGFMEGFHYVWGRADLRAIMIMLFLIGTFGLNFPILISTMAVKVLHSDAKGFGLLSSIMAVGTISGALLAAGRDKPRFRSLFIGAIVFSIGCTLAALSPGYWWFAGSLVQKVAAALADSLHPGTVLDGELVALDSNGNPHFNALQMLALSIREMQKELLLEGGIESSLGGLHGDYKALGLVSDFTKEKESSQTSREVARGSLPLFTAS